MNINVLAPARALGDGNFRCCRLPRLVDSDRWPASLPSGIPDLGSPFVGLGGLARFGWEQVVPFFLVCNRAVVRARLPRFWFLFF